MQGSAALKLHSKSDWRAQAKTPSVMSRVSNRWNPTPPAGRMGLWWAEYGFPSHQCKSRHIAEATAWRQRRMELNLLCWRPRRSRVLILWIPESSQVYIGAYRLASPSLPPMQLLRVSTLDRSSLITARRRAQRNWGFGFERVWRDLSSGLQQLRWGNSEVAVISVRFMLPLALTKG